LYAALALSGCGGSPQTDNSEGPEPTAVPAESNLPDRITCHQSDSDYQLVLILKDQALPDGVTAIGLKKGDDVLFKISTQTYTEVSEPRVLNFVETPSTPGVRRAKLYLATKEATLSQSQILDLDSTSVFSCKF